MDYTEAKKLADDSKELALKLLSKEKLTKEEEIQMSSAAAASLYLWGRAGTAIQVARAHWLCSRVFAQLKEAKLAYQHAQLCDFHTKKAGDRKDFDEAYAMEALARASALKGDQELAKKYRDDAVALGQKIRDPEDKKKFESALN